MTKKTNPRLVARLRRKRRIRANITGTTERPRLSVFRSNKHIYAQVIDDTRGVTLATASEQTTALADELKGLKKSERAKVVGQHLAAKCKEIGIERVVFDRNGFIFHGRVKALADGARDGGLQF